MTSSSEGTLTAAAVTRSTRLFDLGKGKFVSEQALKVMLPKVETALFFAKAYHLNYVKLSELIRLLFKTDVIDALLREGGEHSVELQDYIIDTVPEDVQAEHGMGTYTEAVPAPDTELLAQVWEQAETEVAKSIAEVAEKLGNVLDKLPSKYGSMTFEHMRKLNHQRGTLGRYSATIQHQHVAPRLVIFDVSGSMSEPTVRRIVSEVVGLSYKVEASLAIVSNNAFLWEAGTFDEDTVLRHAEFGGTQYEMLTPILDRDWETVITIADYDSSWSAKEWIRDHATGSIEQVLDISLVNRVTYLAECLGSIAKEIRPLLVGNSGWILR